jgi:hypothetical protein
MTASPMTPNMTDPRRDGIIKSAGQEEETPASSAGTYVPT